MSGESESKVMSSEEAMDSFSEAYDGELDETQRAAFDAALAADSDLAEEYADFAEVLDGTHAMHTGGTAAPDLLKGIQRKIRERSGGRFFRDRFAARKQMGVAWLTLLLVAVTFLIAGAAFFGLYYVQLSEEDRQQQEEELEEPGLEQPGLEEPGTEAPGTEAPGTEEPAATEEPATEEPATEEPATEETPNP